MGEEGKEYERLHSAIDLPRQTLSFCSSQRNLSRLIQGAQTSEYVASSARLSRPCPGGICISGGHRDVPRCKRQDGLVTPCDVLLSSSGEVSPCSRVRSAVVRWTRAEVFRIHPAGGDARSMRCGNSELIQTRQLNTARVLSDQPRESRMIRGVWNDLLVDWALF